MLCISCASPDSLSRCGTDAGAACWQDLLGERGQRAELERAHKGVCVLPLHCSPTSITSASAQRYMSFVRTLIACAALCCSYVQECKFPPEGEKPKSLRYVGRSVMRGACSAQAAPFACMNEKSARSRWRLSDWNCRCVQHGGRCTQNNPVRRQLSVSGRRQEQARQATPALRGEVACCRFGLERRQRLLLACRSNGCTIYLVCVVVLPPQGNPMAYITEVRPAVPSCSSAEARASTAHVCRRMYSPD